MSKFKTSLLTLVSAMAVFGASSASAASYEIWNGSAWVNSGTSHFTGPTTAVYSGIQAPCNADFTVVLSGGAASVTAASFSGSSTCAGITASNLPWPLSAPSAYSGPNPVFSGSPTLTPALWSVTISGVRINIPAPLNANCPSASGSGSVPGVLDANSYFVFKATLGPCSVQTRTNQAPNALVASPAVRVVP
ncbi:hypothetical protein [Pseudomonas sp. CGJS7]|uniref:hypothetical protein n=1 Tax=Pseudomonas sp. CGJS7 TaxID=3109348 RepID=UPI003008E1F8